jgi:hypothetical protein
MDMEALENRLRDLQKQFAAAQNRLQQAQADVIAISGAIQEVNYWIWKMKNENKTDEKGE